MNSTTLMTFLLQVPKSISTVEVLGSWDNFSRPYPLERDKSVGRGHWRGCHSFTGITCDGDASVNGVRRDGGLLMGGTYWYYYRLDNDIEYYDPVRPYTNNCPLLPGQGVNILEVPIEVKPLTNRGLNASTTSFGSAVFTMDPQDKYLPHKPSVHRSVASRLSGISKSSLANLSARFARLVTRQSPDHSRVVCRSAKERCKSSSYLPGRWPPQAGFQKQRATKSAGDDLSSGSPHLLIATTRKLSDSALDTLSNARGSVTASLAGTATNVHLASGFTESQPDNPEFHSADHRELPNTVQDLTHPAKQSVPPPAGNDCLARLTQGKPASQSSCDDEARHDWYHAAHHHTASTNSSSHFSNDMCSLSFGPSTDPTGSTSPRRSSKSGSPMSGDQRRNISWIEDRSDASIAYTAYQPTETSQLGLRVPSPRFSGSSLPEADHDSMLTIKQHPSSHFEPPGLRSPLHQNDSQVLVQAWNDGTKHPTTALEELIDDLGYLGKLII